MQSESIQSTTCNSSQNALHSKTEAFCSGSGGIYNSSSAGGAGLSAGSPLK